VASTSATSLTERSSLPLEVVSASGKHLSSLKSERVETLSSAAEARDRGEMRLVLVLFALLALGNVDTQVMAPLLPAIARGLGTSESWIGRTVSGYAIAAAIAALVAGPLSDRLGRRRFLAGSALLLGAASALSAVAPSFPGFALARVATGAGAGVISALSVAAIADIVPYERRGRSMGFVATAYTAAPVLGVPIAAFVADSVGWRANYMAFAAAGILLGLAVEIWFRESPPVSGAVPRRYLSFFSTRATALGVISAFFITGGVTGFLLFLGAYLQKEVGLTLGQVGMVFLWSGVASLAGAFGAGTLSDRVGKRKVALASCLGLSLFLLAVPRVEGLALYGVLGLVGIAVAARLAPLQSIVTELVPAESRGAYVALRNTVSQSGNAAAAIGSAALYPSGFENVCAMAAVFSLIAFVLLLGIEEPR
jgi:MFS transporter, DHA1 family, inner membrane transport protein